MTQTVVLLFRWRQPRDITLRPEQNGCHFAVLPCWGRHKVAAIFRTTFSNAFSWIKMYEFRVRIHLSLFLSVQLTTRQHWFSGNGLAPNRRQAISWTNANPVHWRIYAALGRGLHFDYIFLEIKWSYFDSNSLKFHPLCVLLAIISIGSVNGLPLEWTVSRFCPLSWLYRYVAFNWCGSRMVWRFG